MVLAGTVLLRLLSNPATAATTTLAAAAGPDAERHAASRAVDAAATSRDRCAEDHPIRHRRLRTAGPAATAAAAVLARSTGFAASFLGSCGGGCSSGVLWIATAVDGVVTDADRVVAPHTAAWVPLRGGSGTGGGGGVAAAAAAGSAAAAAANPWWRSGGGCSVADAPRGRPVGDLRTAGTKR